MPGRVIIAYILIALMVAAIAATVARLRYMSAKNVRRRERDLRGY